jgi:hypothetical protein
MAIKSVVIHTCIHADMYTGQPLKCSCARHTTRKHADEIVASGAAVFKRDTLGAVDYLQILLTGRRPKVPRAATIEKVHIVRAYVQGKESDQERIELYDEMTQESFVELGAKERKRVVRYRKIAGILRARKVRRFYLAA